MPSSSRRISEVSGSAQMRPRARPGRSMLTHSSFHSTFGCFRLDRSVVDHHGRTSIDATKPGGFENELLATIGEQKGQRLRRGASRVEALRLLTRLRRPAVDGDQLPRHFRGTVVARRVRIPFDPQFVGEPAREAVVPQIVRQRLDRDVLVDDDALRARVVALDVITHTRDRRICGDGLPEDAVSRHRDDHRQRGKLRIPGPDPSSGRQQSVLTLPALNRTEHQNESERWPGTGSRAPDSEEPRPQPKR